MIPETISTFEIARLIVAIMGIRAALLGRRIILSSAASIPTTPSGDPLEIAQREQRRARMALFLAAQQAILLVHGLLLLNVLVNFGYGSAPIEQPNVMTSNLAQFLIPLILTRLSELVTLEMDAGGRIRTVIAPIQPSQEGHS